MLTAFEGTEDASMNVRLLNQNLIRGYIRDAPLGFGIGSTGYYGAKYSPNSFIGTFPPDSELVKIAIETGWIGLFFWCIILILIFTYGVNAYFRARDAEIKALMVVPLVVFCAMIIGLYPQECFRAPVLGTLFSFMIGLIAKLKSLDQRSVSH
jgi:O-antigen ligase